MNATSAQRSFPEGLHPGPLTRFLSGEADASGTDWRFSIDEWANAIFSTAKDDPGLALLDAHAQVGRFIAGEAGHSIGQAVLVSAGLDNGGAGDSFLRATLSPDTGIISVSGRQRFTAPRDGHADIVVRLQNAQADGGGFVFRAKAGSDLIRIVEDGPGFGLDHVKRGFVSFPAPLDGSAMTPLAGADFEKQNLQASLLLELAHAAIEDGILRSFFDAALTHFQTRSRPWQGSALERISDDPHALSRLGETIANFQGLSLLFDDAVRAVSRPRSVADAVLAVAHLRAHASSLGKQGISRTIELLGSSSVRERFGFSRHWQNFTDLLRQAPPLWGPAFLGQARALAVSERVVSEALDRVDGVVGGTFPAFRVGP